MNRHEDISKREHAPSQRGAIYYITKYGSTADYVRWISDQTGLPAYRTDDDVPEPGEFDFLIIVTPIYYYKPLIRRWLRRNADVLKKIPAILVTVSGAPAGAKLDGWIKRSLPDTLYQKIEHFALQGRQIPSQLGWFDWLMLRIAAMRNPDPVASKQESSGFDLMDRSGIAPIVARVTELQHQASAQSEG